MSPKNLTTVLLAGSVLGIGGYFLGANLIVARKNARIEQIRRTYVAAPENETAKQVYESARKHQNELKSYRTVTLRPGKTNDLQVRVEKLHLKQDGKYFSKSSTRTLAGSRQVGVTITSLRNADGTWVLVGDEVAILDNTPRRMPVAVSTIQRTRSAGRLARAATANRGIVPQDPSRDSFWHVSPTETVDRTSASAATGGRQLAGETHRCALHRPDQLLRAGAGRPSLEVLFSPQPSSRHAGHVHRRKGSAAAVLL